MVFLSRENLPRIKDETYVINLDDKQSKGIHWVSFYLLTQMLLCTLILLELNILLKKYQIKSKINQLLTIYLECKIMILVFVDLLHRFYRIYDLRKIFC